MPITRYRERFNPAFAGYADASFTYFSFAGFSPYTSLSYAKISSKNDPSLSRCSLAIITGTGGAAWDYAFRINIAAAGRPLLENKWHVNARLSCGMSQIVFSSENFPAPVTDFVTAAGVSAGLSYDLFSLCPVGAGISVQRIFTAGIPLDSVMFQFSAGVRL